MKKRSVLALLLVCASLFAGCARLAGKPAEREIRVFCEELSYAETSAIRAKLNAIPGVIDVQYVSAEEAYQEFLENHEDKEAFEGLDASALRDRYVVTVKTEDWDETIAEIEAIEGVAEVS